MRLATLWTRQHFWRLRKIWVSEKNAQFTPVFWLHIIFFLPILFAQNFQTKILVAQKKSLCSDSIDSSDRSDRSDCSDQKGLSQRKPFSSSSFTNYLFSQKKYSQYFVSYNFFLAKNFFHAKFVSPKYIFSKTHFSPTKFVTQKSFVQKKYLAKNLSGTNKNLPRPFAPIFFLLLNFFHQKTFFS